MNIFKHSSSIDDHRYVPNNSDHRRQEKMASLSFLIHPLSHSTQRGLEEKNVLKGNNWKWPVPKKHERLYHRTKEKILIKYKLYFNLSKWKSPKLNYISFPQSLRWTLSPHKYDKKINAFESEEVNKEDHLMNNDRSPVTFSFLSSLLKLAINMISEHSSQGIMLVNLFCFISSLLEDVYSMVWWVGNSSAFVTQNVPKCSR